MRINTFEDSFVRQRSQILATDLRNIILTNRDYSYKDQIMRAVTSISNNI